MPNNLLNDLADEFASEITTIVNSTIATEVLFAPINIGRSSLYIAPIGSIFGKSKLIPVADLDGAEKAPFLWLKVGFEVDLDHEGKHLRVLSSIFALVVNEESALPAVRIEYERERGFEPGEIELSNHAKNAAHVQIHGTSTEFAYIQGKNGDARIKPLEKYHIPVGGKEFRPTLEDFIEFLHREGLVKKLKPGWLELIRENQRKWLTVQVKSAVRSNPSAAIEQLLQMGYKVSN